MGRVNDKIELPNGDTFDHKPHVALIESPLDTTYIVGLGGLYVKDIELKEQKELLLTTGREAETEDIGAASRLCVSYIII